MKSTISLLPQSARVYLPVLLGLLLTLPAIVLGQSSDGNVVGSVFDPTGAAVRDAKIELVNKATGVKFNTVSGAEGAYRVGNVPVGTYTATAMASGFATNQIENVQVSLSQTVAVNFNLTLSSQSQTVQVSESVATVDTTSSQITNTYQTKTALELTMASAGVSGVLNLSLLAAGVSSGTGVGYGSGPSIGGQRPTNNNFQIEGMDNNRRDVTGPIVSISNEAIAEFSLGQNLFSADVGHSSGGQFNTILKTGTNQLHGSLYEYMQNRNLNAVDVSFARQGILSNPRYDQNRFGGTIGGPIIKNRWFYFGNFERDNIGQASTAPNAIFAPTAAGYSVLAGLPGLKANNLAFLKQYVAPAGTQAGTITVGGQNVPYGILENVGPSFQNNTNIFASTDFDVTSKDRLRYRYAQNTINTIDTNPSLPLFYGTQPTRQYLTKFSYFKTLSASMTNEASFGYTRFTQTVPTTTLKFPGLDAFPNITIDDLNGIQIGPDPNGPQSTIINTYQLTDNFSWVHGRSNWKFGYDGRKLIAPQFFVQRVRGDYDYSSLEQFLLDKAPDFGERSAGASPWSGDLFSHYLYANNDYRLRSNLTLNLGVRYEWIDVAAGDKLQARNSISSVPGLITFGAPKSQKNAWAPRLGVAWSPGKSGTTSVRAGFGLAYDQVYQNLGILSLPPQFTTTLDVGNAGLPAVNDPNFLANGGLPGVVSGALSASAARAATGAYVPDQKRPYAVNWSASVQHRFGNDLTIEARYTGTHGIHLPTQIRLNRTTPITATNSLPTYLANPGQAALNALPLTLAQLQAIPTNSYASAGFNSNIVAFEPWGNSIYHGLALQANKRMSHNVMFIGSYTWSHNIDDSTAAVFSTYVAPRRAQDFQNLRADRASSLLDRRQRFTFTASYDFLAFRNGNWLMKNLVGNWTVNGVYIAESPVLATVQSGVDSNLNGDNAGDRAIVNPAGQAGVGSGVTALKNSSGGTVAYLATNPNAQYIVAGVGAYATAGRNTLPLRGINNVDASLFKNFNITESKKLQFRAEASNLFNHAQFVPGFVNDVRPPQTLNQTRAFLLPNNAAFGNPEVAYASNSRTMQLAVRFIF